MCSFTAIGCVTKNYNPDYKSVSLVINDFPEVTDKSRHQNLQIAIKKNLSLACNPKHRIASWVQFELTKQNIESLNSLRLNSYVVDLQLVGPCRVNDSEYIDYTSHGYDRGHLADAKSLSYSIEARKEVAFTSNLVPQVKGLNRGLWKKLEDWERFQAKKQGNILVITGPILIDDLKKLKPGISIPESFYKIIIALIPPQKSIGFVMQQGSKGSINSFVVCPDKIEQMTGLKFFNSRILDQTSGFFENCAFNQWEQ